MVIGAGRLITVKEVVSNIFELMDVQTPPQFGAIPDRKNETVIAANVQQTKELTGWMPKTSFEVGLKKTIDWYKEHYPLDKII